MSITQKTRSIDIGGSAFERDIISKSVQGWTREQVHAALRQTTVDIAGQQAKLGNVASSITVDNSTFKSIDQAERKTVVIFGTHLAKAVITAVQRALMTLVETTTDKRTGQLANLANWEWTYVPGDGKGSARHVDPFSIQSLAITDRLILRPRVIYATAVNQNVAGGRRGVSLKTRTKKGKRYREQAKRLTRIGFFGATAELLRRDTSINQSFSIYAGFTQRHIAPGEVATAGRGGARQTAQIVLRPKKRGRIS